MPSVIHIYVSKSNPKNFYAFRSEVTDAYPFVTSIKSVGVFPNKDIIVGPFSMQILCGVKHGCPDSVSIVLMFDGGCMIEAGYTCDLSETAAAYNGITPFTITNTMLFTYNHPRWASFTIDIGDLFRK